MLNTQLKIQPKYTLFKATICSANGKRYRYGFNGKEKDNETYGEGNAYDFGARIYDSRLGRWMACDPLYIKYPHESTYCYVGNQVFVFIDPNGKEKIIVIGGADDAGDDEAKFANAGLLQLKNYINDVRNSGEKITIIIATDGLTAENIQNIQYEIDLIKFEAESKFHYNDETKQMEFWNYNINLTTVSTDKEMVNYFNSGNKSSDELNEFRKADPISGMTLFGHGLVGKGFTPGYPNTKETSTYGTNNNIGATDLSHIKKGAFSSGAQIGIYSCNAATTSNGTNFALEMSKATGATVFGWAGKTSYAHMYNPSNLSTWSNLSMPEKAGAFLFFSDQIFNLQLRISDNLPKGDESNPRKVTYSNGKETTDEK